MRLPSLPGTRSRLVTALAVAVAVVAVGVVGVTTIAGGSSEPAEREYALPDTLCGLEVDEELYAPLFPPGSELSVDATFADDDPLFVADLCSVKVDGDLAIWSYPDGGDSIADYLVSLPTYVTGEPVDRDAYEMSDGIPVDGEYEAMVWPGLAVVGTSCRPSSEPLATDSLTIGIGTTYDDEEESVEILSQLVQPYMRAALERSLCEPGPNPDSRYSSS